MTQRLLLRLRKFKRKHRRLLELIEAIHRERNYLNAEETQG